MSLCGTGFVAAIMTHPVHHNQEGKPMFKKGGIGRQLLTMALIAIPWFFRDQFATSLDEEAREAQQVLSEKGDHEQRQQQNRDNREVMSLLARIDLKQRTNTEIKKDIEAEEARLWSKDAKDDGKLLGGDVAAFKNLLPRVSMGDDRERRKEMVDIATQAETVAKRLEAFNPETEETDSTSQAITLQNDFDNADIGLRQAWKDLEEEAQKDQQNASAAATTARIIAWVCTAIGALVVGDWKKLLAGFAGGDNQTDPTPMGRKA
jgi:hypothetical protein